MSDEHEESTRTIVVGVLPEQPLWVLQVAADFARSFDAELICVAVDAARYAYQELPDGSMLSSPVDADAAAVGPLFTADRLDEIRDLLGPTGVRWSMRELTGVATDALVRVAEEEDALMIVLGARPGGFRGAVRNALTGSVALRIAHRQYRPVVIVPTSPDEKDAVLLDGR